jgi:hypothetical protein
MWFFGDKGLIELDTTVDFTSKVTEIERKYESLMSPYLNDKIIPTIKEYVFRFCSATAFSFSDLLCQVILKHCKWDNGELNSKSPRPYSAPFTRLSCNSIPLCIL